MDIPSKIEIEAAKKRIAPYIHRTPIIKSHSLERLLNRPLFFKAENLQRTGSFKIRGALNKILSLTEEEAKRGVITYSSGNHAQAVALAASIRNISATVIMPPNAPKIKKEATEGYGAQIILKGETSSGRRIFMEKLAFDTGAVIIPPFEDPFVIGGQSTVGL